MSIEFDYQLRRSMRRRSIAIKIKNGEAIVYAPLWLRQRQIEHWLQSKNDWVLDKLALSARDVQQREEKRLVLNQGSQMSVLGNCYTFYVERAAKSRVWIQDKTLHIAVPRRVKDANLNSYVEKNLQHFLAQQLLDLLIPSCNRFANSIGCSFSEVKTKSFRAKWGSCDTKGVLSFNWRLALLPVEFVEYVAAHEVAHLRHFNHSREFWALVRTLYDDVDNAEVFLKEHSGVDFSVCLDNDINEVKRQSD